MISLLDRLFATIELGSISRLINIIDECSKQNVDITNITNAIGMNALHLASRRNQVACIETLLERFPQMMNKQDHFGRTPIFYAVLHNHIEALEAFLTRRYQETIDLCIQDKDDYTVLMRAVMWGYMDFVKKIILFDDTTVNFKNDRYCNCALFACVLSDNVEMAELLLTVGNADASLVMNVNTNKHNKTYEYIMNYEHCLYSSDSGVNEWH